MCRDFVEQIVVAQVFKVSGSGLRKSEENVKYLKFSKKNNAFRGVDAGRVFTIKIQHEISTSHLCCISPTHFININRIQHFGRSRKHFVSDMMHGFRVHFRENLPDTVLNDHINTDMLVALEHNHRIMQKFFDVLESVNFFLEILQ